MSTPHVVSRRRALAALAGVPAFAALASLELTGCAPDLEVSIRRVQGAMQSASIQVRVTFDVRVNAREAQQTTVRTALIARDGRVLVEDSDPITLDVGYVCLCYTITLPNPGALTPGEISVRVVLGDVSASQPLGALMTGTLGDCSASCNG